jgi:sulfonate transport system substrate-binding protein
MRGRIFAGLLLLLAAGLVACDQGGGGAALRVASQRGGTRAVMEAAGVLQGAPYPIEWSEFPSAQALLEALRGGAVDVGAVGDAPFIFAYANGAPIRAVQALRAQPDGGGTAIVVPAGSPIQTPADLRGKRIATGRGSIGHYLLLLALERAGLKPSDVTVVFLSPGDAKAALSSGSVDAWSTWGSYVALATLQDHARVIADSRGLLHGTSFEAASDAAIRDKRPQLQDFLARLARAQAWAQSHPDAYAAALARDTGLPLDIAQATVARSRTIHAAPIDDGVAAQERDTLAHFRAAGVIDTAPDISGAFDRSFNSASGAAAAPGTPSGG